VFERGQIDGMESRVSGGFYSFSSRDNARLAIRARANDDMGDMETMRLERACTVVWGSLFAGVSEFKFLG
jgi:hypothetical protein